MTRKAKSIETCRFFFFSSRRRHTRLQGDWSSDVCSSDLDLYPEFQGDPYSHACPFARIMDEKLADQLVQVGIRTMNATQRTQAERHGVDVIDMRAWVTGRRPALEAPIYISIDLDAFDPAFAPGVGHREPGGLTVRDVLAVLHGLEVPLVGADVVEFNPAQDASGVTAAVCAKLVKELAGTMLARS